MLVITAAQRQKRVSLCRGLYALPHIKVVTISLDLRVKLKARAVVGNCDQLSRYFSCRNARPSEGRFMCLFPALRGDRSIWPCAKLSSEYT